MTKLYRHNKRGTVYRILEPGEIIPLGSSFKMQVEMESDDGEEAVAYVDITDASVVWVRNKSWFFDGRFAEMTLVEAHPSV